MKKPQTNQCAHDIAVYDFFQGTILIIDYIIAIVFLHYSLNGSIIYFPLINHEFPLTILLVDQLLPLPLLLVSYVK